MLVSRQCEYLDGICLRSRRCMTSRYYDLPKECTREHQERTQEQQELATLKAAYQDLECEKAPTIPCMPSSRWH